MMENSVMVTGNVGVKVTIDRKKLDNLILQLPIQLEAILEIAARNIELKAKDRVPVDTGATKNSISVTKPRAFQRRVGPTTHYAPHLEFGTHRMPARPFIVPSAKSEEPRLQAAAVAMLKRLGT